MSATERAREAFGRLLARHCWRGNVPADTLDRTVDMEWRIHAEVADLLASLPLPDRLALLLSESERADRKKLDEAFRATLLLARLKWGNLDPDANGIFALADEALAASEAAHAG